MGKRKVCKKVAVIIASVMLSITSVNVNLPEVYGSETEGDLSSSSSSSSENGKSDAETSKDDDKEKESSDVSGTGSSAEGDAKEISDSSSESSKGSSSSESTSDSSSDSSSASSSGEEDEAAESSSSADSSSDEMVFTDSSESGVDVEVTAENGAFPEGTQMLVSSVSKDEAARALQEIVGDESEVIDAEGVDISFSYEGEEVQPADGMTVDVVISLSKELDDNDDDSAQVLVGHVHDNDGSIVDSKEADTTGAEFSIGSFSTFYVGTTTDATDKNISVNGNLYSSFSDAYDAIADSGDTITILSDNVVDDFTKEISKSFKIDLEGNLEFKNGLKFSGSDISFAVTGSSDYTMTVSNSSDSAIDYGSEGALTFDISGGAVVKATSTSSYGINVHDSAAMDISVKDDSKLYCCDNSGDGMRFTGADSSITVGADAGVYCDSNKGNGILIAGSNQISITINGYMSCSGNSINNSSDGLYTEENSSAFLISVNGTLDLNDNYNGIVARYSTISVNEGAVLNVKNNLKQGILHGLIKTFDGANINISDSAYGIVYSSLYIQSGADVEISNCTGSGVYFGNNSYGTAKAVDSVDYRLYAESGSTFKISDCGTGICARNATELNAMICDGCGFEVTGCNNVGIWNAGNFIMNGGSVHDNTAVYGAGVLNVSKGTFIQGGSATIYNNHNVTTENYTDCGDDIYNMSGTIILRNQASEGNLILSDDGAVITGWFIDGIDTDGNSTDRWAVNDYYQSVSDYEDGALIFKSTVALKAAHGLITNDDTTTTDTDTTTTTTSSTTTTTESTTTSTVLGATRTITEEPAVLGATRESEDTPAVLGASRNAATGDYTNVVARALVIIICAGAVGFLVSTKRKKSGKF